MKQSTKQTWSKIGWGALMGAGALVGGVPGIVGVMVAKKNNEATNYNLAQQKLTYTQTAQAYTGYSSVGATMTNDEQSFNATHGFI